MKYIVVSAALENGFYHVTIAINWRLLYGDIFPVNYFFH
jgi:hypothetical protein